MLDELIRKAPDMYAYAVRETEDKSYFTRIGVAFAHAKGDGFSIELNALPVNRKIILFPPKEEAYHEPG